MDTIEYLKKLVANSICDCVDCTQCKSLFNAEECPAEDFNPDKRISLARGFAEKLNVGPVDLGELKDLNVDDLLKLVTEVTESYTPKEEPPQEVQDDERAAARRARIVSRLLNEVELPF